MTVGDAVQAVSGIAALGACFVSLKLQAGLAAFRAETIERAVRDKEDLRQWINGSFLRSAVVEAQIAASTNRVVTLERRVERLEDEG